MVHNTTFDARFGTLWIFMLLGTSLIVVLTQQHDLYRRLGVRTILFVALLARLVPAVVLNAGASFDIKSYSIIGHLVIAGHDVYTTPAAAGRYPYLPAQLWLSAFGLQLQAWLGGAIPFVVLAKTLPVLADTGIALALVTGVQNHGLSAPAARVAALVYALNPVSILVTAYHGQFDAIPVLFCVMAWVVVTRRSSTYAAAALSGLALGVAILFKSWPVLLLPSFLFAYSGIRKRIVVCSGAGIVPCLATVTYVLRFHVPLRSLATTVLGYTSTPGWWGVGAFGAWLHGRAHLLTASNLTDVTRVTELAVVVGAVIVPLLHGDGALEQNVLSVLLVFYVVSANFAVQYLLWVMPFGAVSLVRSRATRLPIVLFLTLATTALLTTYMAAGWMYHVVPDDGWLASKGWQISFYVAYAATIWWCVREVGLPAASNPKRAIRTPDAGASGYESIVPGT